MKKLNLFISLDGIKLSETDREKSPQELCAIVIKNIILSWGNSQRGLSEDDRRKYYKISDLFDSALKNRLDEVEMEDDWFGFIRKCKKETPMLPDDILRRVEENIDAVEYR